MSGITVGTEKLKQIAQNGLNHECNDRVLKLLPKPVKVINSVKDFTGEFGTNCINAVGTGLVAPVFIAYNPLSKTDEQTKKYSALRQPVSAALAVAMQVAFVYPFNQFVAFLANNGMLPEHLNKSILKDSKYIAKDVKRESQAKCIDKATLKAEIQKRQEDAYVRAMEDIVKNGTLNGMTESQFKDLLEETRDSLLKKEEKRLKFLKETKTKQYAQRLEYFKDNTETAEKLFGEIETFLKENHSEKETTKYFKKLISSNKHSSKELLSILKDLKECKDTSSKLHFLKSTKEHFEKAVKNKDNWHTIEDIENYLLKKDKKHIASIESVQKKVNFLKNLKDSIKDKSAKEVVEQICDATRGKVGFLFQVVEKEIENIDMRFKSYKDGTGLLVGFVTLPISCTLLNWLYPMFMERFFPNLCANKTNENSDTFKKQEVKK